MNWAPPGTCTGSWSPGATPDGTAIWIHCDEVAFAAHTAHTVSQKVQLGVRDRSVSHPVLLSAQKHVLVPGLVPCQVSMPPDFL